MIVFPFSSGSRNDAFQAAASSWLWQDLPQLKQQKLIDAAVQMTQANQGGFVQSAHSPERQKSAAIERPLPCAACITSSGEQEKEHHFASWADDSSRLRGNTDILWP